MLGGYNTTTHVLLKITISPNVTLHVDFVKCSYISSFPKEQKIIIITKNRLLCIVFETNDAMVEYDTVCFPLCALLAHGTLSTARSLKNAA